MKNNPEDVRLRQKLLIVDDDEATRLLIMEVLEDTFLEIIEARNGEEAIRNFDNYLDELALVFLDIKLPDKSGWDLAASFRRKNCLIPIVIVSAISPTELIEKNNNLNIDLYLLKPFNIQNLRQVVEYCMEQKSATI